MRVTELSNGIEEAAHVIATRPIVVRIVTRLPIGSLVDRERQSQGMGGGGSFGQFKISTRE